MRTWRPFWADFWPMERMPVKGYIASLTIRNATTAITTTMGNTKGKLAIIRASRTATKKDMLRSS